MNISEGNKSFLWRTATILPSLFHGNFRSHSCLRADCMPLSLNIIHFWSARPCKHMAHDLNLNYQEVPLFATVIISGTGKETYLIFHSLHKGFLLSYWDPLMKASLKMWFAVKVKPRNGRRDQVPQDLGSFSTSPLVLPAWQGGVEANYSSSSLGSFPETGWYLSLLTPWVIPICSILNTQRFFFSPLFSCLNIDRYTRFRSYFYLFHLAAVSFFLQTKAYQEV